MKQQGSWYEANKPKGRTEVLTFGAWPLKSLLKKQVNYFNIQLPQFLEDAIENDNIVNLRTSWELNTGYKPENIAHMLDLMDGPPPEVLSISRALNYAISQKFKLHTMAEMKKNPEEPVITTV